MGRLFIDDGVGADGGSATDRGVVRAGELPQTTASEVLQGSARSGVGARDDGINGGDGGNNEKKVGFCFFIWQVRLWIGSVRTLRTDVYEFLFYWYFIFLIKNKNIQKEQ